MAGQNRLKPLLDQLSPGAKDSGEAGVQRFGNTNVAPALASLRCVSFQKDAGFRQQQGRTFALVDEVLQLLAFVRAQIHHILVDGSLFHGHESELDLQGNPPP